MSLVPAKGHNQPIVIEDDEDDDQSSNDDVLPADGNIIMVGATPSTSKPAKASKKGEEKLGSEAKTGKVQITGVRFHCRHLRIHLSNSLLDKMREKWMSPIYGFFKSEPLTETFDGHACPSLKCAAAICRGATPFVCRYTDKRVINGSTGNFHTHAHKCFGNEAVDGASKASNAIEVWKTTLTNGGLLTAQAITVAFEQKGKGKITYSTCPHTKVESRCVSAFPLEMFCFLTCFKCGNRLLGRREHVPDFHRPGLWIQQPHEDWPPPHLYPFAEYRFT